MKWQIISLVLYLMGVYLVYSYVMEDDVRKDWKGNLALSLFFPILVPMSILADIINRIRKKRKAKRDANFRAWEEFNRLRNRF